MTNRSLRKKARFPISTLSLRKTIRRTVFPDRAEEIEDESLEDYAEHRRITLSNRKREEVQRMAIQTRGELLERIEELESENEELHGQLDEIADIVAPGEEGEEQARQRVENPPAVA